MAFDLVQLDAAVTTVDASTINSGSVTPTANGRVVAVVFSADNAPAPVPNATGYTRLASAPNSAVNRRITLFESNGTPSAGAVNFAFGENQGSAGWWVGEVASGFGSPLVRQVNLGAYDGSTGFTVGFADPADGGKGAPLSDSIVLVACTANAATLYDYLGTFTQHMDTGSTSPAIAASVASIDGGAPQSFPITVSGGNVSHAWMVVEIAAGVSGVPVADVSPVNQQSAVGGTFQWDLSGSSGNALSYASVVTNGGTTGATTADIDGATTDSPSMDTTGMTPGTITGQSTVTDAASQTASVEWAATIINEAATLVPYLWDGSQWVQMSGVYLWNGTSWEGYEGAGDPPGTPSGLAATPGDGSVTLTWTAPADPGDGITTYRIEIEET